MSFVDKVFAYAACMCTALGAWLAWSYHQPSVEAEAFQRASWLDGANVLLSVGDPGCVRGAMALDLIDSSRLVGMHASDVAELLGPPGDERSVWRYRLGQCSGFGWEDSVMTIQFDGQRKVSAAVFERAS